MKLLKTHSSLSRDFTYYSIVIVAILVTVSVMVSFDIYQSFSERIFKKLQFEATRIDRNLIVNIEHSAYLLESLGRQISHHGTDDKVMIAQLLNSFDTNTISNNVLSFIDENQFSVASSNKGILKEPVDVSDRDFVKKSITDPWHIQIGRPIEGRVSEKWVIPIAMGITDDTGKFLGTILVSIDIHALGKGLAGTLSERNMSFSIISENFIPLTQTAEDNARINNAFSIEALQQSFPAHKSGILSIPSLINPDKEFWYYEVSSKYPYLIVMNYNTTLWDESLMDDFRRRIVATVMIGAFMIWVLWEVKRRIIRPVVQLTENAAAIARGEIFSPLSDPGPMEVSLLSSQIQKIDAYLQERRRVEEELQNKTLHMKRAKEAAEFNNRVKAEFISCMGHELKTPLNTIIGFSEVMKNQMFGPIENNRYQQYCEDIHHTGKQMLDTINDMLTVTKTEAGLSPMDEQPVEVEAILQKCGRLLADRIQQQHIVLHLQVQEHLPKLIVDELRLKQIILNLLSNAVKFSPQGGEITIEAKIDNDDIGNTIFVIRITDHGKGMSSKEVAELLLDNKHQADKISAHTHTGIGIPLTRTLLALHQGNMSIHSTLGIGTAVTITFPKERIVFWN